jgi:hypothetical protein
MARSNEFATGEQRASQVPSAADARSGTTDFDRSSTPDLLLDELNAKRPIVTRARVIMGVAAIVVVGALVAVFYRTPHPGNPPAVSQQPAASAPASAPATVKPVPSPQTAPPAQNRAAQPKPATPKKTSKVEESSEEAEAKPKPKEPTAEVDGFFAKDIPVLLQMAQSAVGSGKYDDAEHEYKVILLLQPGNPDAAQGLHKLDLIRKEKNR